MRLAQIVAIFAFTIAPTLVQAFEINPTDKVKDIIDKFRTEMSVLVTQTGQETRASMTHAFKLADALIGIAEKSLGNLLDKTFSELDNGQQRALSDANAILNRIKPGIEKSAAEVLDVTKQTQQWANRVAAWSNKPIFTSYGPDHILTHEMKDKDIEIVINGVSLFESKKKASLLINGANFLATENLDTRIKFLVPRGLFPTPDKRIEKSSAALTIFYPQSSTFESLFNNEPDMIVYNLSFSVLPKELGSFTHTVVEDLKFTEPVKISTLTLSTKNAGGETFDEKCVKAPPNTTIDYARSTFISKAKYGGAGADHDSNIDNRHNFGDFSRSLELPGEVCLRITARIGCNSRCASRSDAVAEVWVLNPKTEPKTTIKQGVLEWKDYDLELVEGARSQTLYLGLFDAPLRVHPTTEPSMVANFLEIAPDLRNSKVYLRPRKDF